MGKIIFFEEQNFQGKSHDCEGNLADLHLYIHGCKSVKIESGWWVLYERNNYTGYQIVLGPGEYKNYGMGFDDLVRSCRIIKNTKGPHKLMLFTLPNFGGRSLELKEDVQSLQEKWPKHEVQSCKVQEGSWLFFEQSNFCGRHFLLEEGEYRYHSDWGAQTTTVASIRKITEL